MYVYQDLVKIGDNEDLRMEFIRSAINEHKSTHLYKSAVTGNNYFNGKNETICNYQKVLYTVSGKVVPDNWSANYKMASGYFRRFIIQEIQTLLGNGITWEKEDTAEKLGADFTTKLETIAENARKGTVGFGFFNLDHMESFSVTEYVPLYDETDGSMKAGIRWWQVDKKRPMRATLYELDGYTEYIWIDGEGSVKQEKRPYIMKVEISEAEGERIYDGENYSTFPIVPLWGDLSRKNELERYRETIDCIDLIRSSYADSVDEASLIYWTLTNAGGMDDIDLTEFVERIKTVHATALPDAVSAESHTLDAPYQSREAILTRLERDLYRDAMALDTYSIASGAITATQIKAAYEPFNNKMNRFKSCIEEFLRDVLKVAGIDDKPTFTPSIIINESESIQSVLLCATALSDEYVTKKILTILGDGDKVAEVLAQKDAEEVNRFKVGEQDGFGTQMDGQSD